MHIMTNEEVADEVTEQTYIHARLFTLDSPGDQCAIPLVQLSDLSDE